MKKCKQGYYYCYTDEVCKPIPKGLRVTARFSGGGKEPEETGIDVPTNGNGDGNGGDGGGGMSEGSLRKWFLGSESKDKKPGWVNVVTGDSCASDKPGEGIPKCVSSAKRASMSKKERLAAAAAKRRKDPGQQQKTGAAKPTMVKTDRKTRKEEMEITETKDKKGKGSGTKDACYHKVKSRYSVWPSAYASGALVKCRKKGASNWGNKSESVEFSNWRDDFQATEYEFVDIIKPEPIKGGQEQIDEGQKCWKGYEKKGTKKMFGKVVNNCVKKEGYDVGDIDQKVGAVTPIPKDEREAAKQRLLAKAKAKREKMKEEKEESKVGGGNLKKLSVQATKRVDADVDGDVDSVDMKSSETGSFVPSPDGKKLKPKVRFEDASDWRSELDEGWKSTLAGAGVAAALMSQGGQKAPDKKTTTSPSRSNTERVSKTTQSKNLSPMDKWRKNHPGLAKKSDNPPEFKRKKLSPINKDWAKANPKLAEKEKDNRSKLGEGAAWTKKSGKNKKGGLNEKGRKSYEAENPGSDLKAPSKKKGNKRRASFCARMKGMKKKLTSAKTARDPDSRINKSLRAWNC